MIFIIEQGLLDTDLDAGNFTLLNVGGFNPLPPGLVSSTDPRLTDNRVPIDGSVTNASVSSSAAIVQSKLNLNGVIPTAWLGTTSTTAAEGDLAEYVANKGQPNGYASLDGTTKLPSAQVPVAVGTGTVTSVGLTMPAQFSIGGSPITGAGTLAVTWNNVADQSWFGNNSGGSAAPTFMTTPLPASLIPSLPASIIASGIFNAGLLPVMVGLGTGHAPGAVPDPGASGGGSLATDYLARDGTFKAAPTLGASYQPTLATPTLVAGTNPTGPVIVVCNSTQPDATIFTSITSSSSGFTQLGPTGSYISVPSGGTTLYVYAARTGFTNSAMATYINTNP